MNAELRSVAVERIRKRRNFWAHATVHLVGSVFLIAVWAMTEYRNAGGWPTGFRTGRVNHDWDPWIIYPLVAGTLALMLHAWIVFVRRPTTEDEIAREIERLETQR
jgi:hypothetical protein